MSFIFKVYKLAVVDPRLSSGGDQTTFLYPPAFYSKDSFFIFLRLPRLNLADVKPLRISFCGNLISLSNGWFGAAFDPDTPVVFHRQPALLHEIPGEL
jgi:hypothetical protein